MSDEANLIIARMLRELSGCKYLYRDIPGGCYDACIKHYKFDKPIEGKEAVVDKFFELLTTPITD